jgi:hypothetical protein
MTALVVMMHSSPETPWSGPGGGIMHESGTEVKNWGHSFNKVQELDQSFLHAAFDSGSALGDEFTQLDASEDDEEEQYERDEAEQVAKQEALSGPLPKIKAAGAKQYSGPLSKAEVASMLHPMDKPKEEEHHEIKHVGALPSNLGLLGVPATVDKPKIIKPKPKMTETKAAAMTFVPSFVKENLLSIDDAWGTEKAPENKKAHKKARKKARKAHAALSGLQGLLDVAHKREEVKKARKKAQTKIKHAHNSYNDLDDAIATLKRKFVAKSQGKEAKKAAKAHEAAMRIKNVRDRLDKLEMGKKTILSDEKTEANKHAALWLLKNHPGKKLSYKLLHELIHWYHVAAHGGVGKEEITSMVDRANKKQLSQATVVAQVTSANAKAAAFHALKENTTPETSHSERFKVANQAVEDVVAASKVLDEAHQQNVAMVAKQKVKKLLALQLALEEKAGSTIGHAAVSAGGFCVLKWWRTALNVGCKAHARR